MASWSLPLHVPKKLPWPWVKVPPVNMPSGPNVSPLEPARLDPPRGLKDGVPK
jgi:hypothetical protein